MAPDFLRSISLSSIKFPTRCKRVLTTWSLPSHNCDGLYFGEYLDSEAPCNTKRREQHANKKHKVQFDAHRTVREEVPVKFRTRDGERVSFEAKKKVKEPVRVKFMAKD